MNKLLLSLLLLLSITTDNYASKSNITKDLAIQLKAKYTNDPIVFTSIETIITYGKNASGEIYATEVKTEEMISLRINNSISRAVTYDAYSEIVSSKCLDNNNKKTLVQPICGNYEQNGIFYSDAKMCVYPFFLSSIGDKATFIYEKKYKDLKYLTSSYFQEKFPIQERVVRIIIPKWLDVALPEYHFDKFNIIKHETFEKGDRIVEYRCSNLPAFKNEDHEVGYSFSYPHILILNKKIIGVDSKQLLISNLSDQYAWYQKLLGELKPNDIKIKPTVLSIISNCKTDMEKIEAIFYWVQDNVRYIAFEDGIAGFKPDEAHLVLEKRFGDCKGMANLLKSMLIIAGFDARLTWLGTNHVMYDYSVASLVVDNHAICTVYLEGKPYFLDATEKYIQISEYAERIQGRQVLVENKSEYLLERIPVLTNSRNLIKRTFNLKIQDDKLSGNYDIAFNGEKKIGIYTYLNFKQNNEAEDLTKKIIAQNENEKRVKTINIKNMYNRKLPFMISGEIEVKNKITVLDNQIYIELDPFQDLKEQRLANDRISDYDLTEKLNINTEISLQIPADYVVTSLPEKLSISNNFYNISAEYKEENGVVIYKKVITSNTNTIHSKDFSSWNNGVEQLNVFYNNQVILTKK